MCSFFLSSTNIHKVLFLCNVYFRISILRRIFEKIRCGSYFERILSLIPKITSFHLEVPLLADFYFMSSVLELEG